jgi:hypothetical protein
MWLAGGLVLAFVATQNFAAIDRSMHEPNPGASLRMQKLGVDDSRMLLRYQAAEQNRYYFEVWENLQLALGLFFFFYLLFGTNEDKLTLGAALALLLIVVLQRFLLTPEIVGTGKLLDFVPDSAPSMYRGRFEVLQKTYLGMEIGKWIIQAGLAALVMGRSRRSSRNSRRQLNVVDKTDYGHINR